MIGITLNTIDAINEFLAIHSLVFTIKEEQWHVLTENVFKVFVESLHYDIITRIDGDFHFNNIIVVDKYSEVRITDKHVLDIRKEVLRNSIDTGVGLKFRDCLVMREGE